MAALPTGRIERRIAKAEPVEVLRDGESAAAKVEAITENVSPRGARLIAASACPPGDTVCVAAPGERLKLLARVIYCQHLPDGRFALGVQLHTRIEKWQKSS